MKGKYIVIEGGEGTGKDTQIALLQKEFSGEQFVYTREPGGTPLGKELRQMLLFESKGKVFPSTELFLFLAVRAQHVDGVVNPALAADKIVISNRSWVSFLAYQIYGREQLEWKPMVDVALANIFKEAPIDLAVILDLSVNVGRERMKAAGKSLDAIEKAPIEMHERIRQGFLTVAKEVPSVVIDATTPIEGVWTDVKKAIQSVL